MTKEQVFNFLSNRIKHITNIFSMDNGEDYLNDELQNSPFEFSLCSGATKAVILIKDANFVVKIPFNYIFDEDYYDSRHADWCSDREEALNKATKEKGDLLTQEEANAICKQFEESEPDSNNDEFYQEFEGATYWTFEHEEGCLGRASWDYCALEAATFKQATIEGLGKYFAAEELYGFLGDHPVYMQERCIALCDAGIDYNSVEVEKKRKTSRKFCEANKLDCFDSLWIGDFLERYGEAEFMRLHDFLTKNNIGDLRACNIGYLNGAPVLIDYSGFREYD